VDIWSKQHLIAPHIAALNYLLAVLPWTACHRNFTPCSIYSMAWNYFQQVEMKFHYTSYSYYSSAAFHCTDDSCKDISPVARIFGITEKQ